MPLIISTSTSLCRILHPSTSSFDILPSQIRKMSFASDLESTTLYLIISLPNPPTKATASIYDRDTTTLDILKPSSSKRIKCAEIDGTQDFEWSLYWHSRRGSGIWYKFVPHEVPKKIVTDGKDPSDRFRRPRPIKVSEVMNRFEMKQSPRLFTQVAGIVRLLHVPDFPGIEIPNYLDWLGPELAVKETKSHIWCLLVYMRMRKHVAKKRRREDLAADKLDITGLMCEALRFGYREVWYAIGRQLPRPVMIPSGLIKDDEKMKKIVRGGT